MAAPDFDPSFKEAGESGGQLGHLVKRMPWIISLARMIPDEAQEWLHPKMAGFIRLNRVGYLPSMQPSTQEFPELYNDKQPLYTEHHGPRLFHLWLALR